jgi:hypothetical protein
MSWYAESDVPHLPVVDLVAGRPGASEEEITGKDIDDCQIMWDFVHLYRLEIDRRKDLCTMLVRLTAKVASDLKGSDAHKLWTKVSKDPDWPDRLMDEDDEDDEDDE